MKTSLGIPRHAAAGQQGLGYYHNNTRGAPSLARDPPNPLSPYDINICAQCSDASVTRLMGLNPKEIRHGQNMKSNFEQMHNIKWVC